MNHIGTISCGAQQADELIPTFLNLLEGLARQHYQLRATRKRLASTWALEEVEQVEALTNELDGYALPYCYFGAHHSDGADYGFWVIEDVIERAREDDALIVSDTADIPRGYSGAVFHINDHGNLTLYQATRGRLREVWAIV